MIKDIAVIVNLPKEHFPFWNDGLREALRVMNNFYVETIHIFNIPDKKPVPEDFDFYLFWGGIIDPRFEKKIFKKQGLLFGGGSTFSANIANFDIIFAESSVDLQDFLQQGAKAKQAFGTNTKIFNDKKLFIKPINLLYPAAFAKWKRHDKFVRYVQKNLDINYDLALAIGYKQPNGWEKECYEICEKQQNIIVSDWVPVDHLANLYNLSQSCYVSADRNGGCQRTILEAKACGLPVIVDSDSPKLLELKDLTPEDVREKWNEKEYARKIYEGIMEVI